MADYDSSVDTWKHIHNVNKLLVSFAIRLLGRGIDHDKSKFSKSEKPLFDIWTPKLADLSYDSEEYQTALEELQPALLHHYKANKHHPEHYREGVAGMDLLDLVEMFCDWKAATLRHKDGDFGQSLEINGKRFSIGLQLRKIFGNTKRNLNW